MAGWSVVASDIDTVMVAQGYAKHPIPIDLETNKVAQSIFDKSYTVDNQVLESSQDINNAYISRHVSELHIKIGRVMNASNETATFTTLQTAAETIGKAITNRSNWTAGTILNATLRDIVPSVNTAKTHAVFDIIFELYYNI